MTSAAKYFNIIWHKYLKIEFSSYFCIPALEEVDKNLVTLMYVDLNYICMRCVDPYLTLKYQIAYSSLFLIFMTALST